MKAQRGMITLAVAALALTACGSADDDAQSSEAANQKVIEIADQPGSVEDYVGAVEDAEVDTCAAGGDGLDVAGTVTNPESETHDHRLHISAMTDGDTVGLVQVDVADVAGGETAEWGMDLAQEDMSVSCESSGSQPNKLTQQYGPGRTCFHVSLGPCCLDARGNMTWSLTRNAWSLQWIGDL